MSAEWFCKIAGKEFGPLSVLELKAMVVEGSLTPNHQVRRGDTAWVKARNVKGLFTDAGAAAAAAPAERPAPAQSAPPPQTAPIASQPVQAPPVQAPAPQAYGGMPTGIPVGVPVAAPARPAAPYAYAPPHAATAAAHPHDEAAQLLLKRRKHKKLMFNLGVGSIAVVAVGGLIAFAVMASKGDAGSTAAAPKPAADIDLFDSEKTPTAPANAVTSPTAAAADKPLEPWRGEVKWVDAAKEPIRRGDVEVRVVQAGPGRPALLAERGAARRTFKNDVLLVKLELKNVGGKPQADYAPWSMRTGGVSMRDNVGRIIRLASVRDRGLFAEGQQEAATVPIESSIEDLLVFQLPVEKFRSLRLELSGVALGQAEPLGFEIPVGMLRAFEPSGRTGSDEIDEENPGASVDRGLGGVEDKPAAPAAPAKPAGIPGVTEHDPFENGSM